MPVDSSFVWGEVFVNCKADHHRAVGKEFSLDLLIGSHDLQGTRLAIVLRLQVILWGICALEVASGIFVLIGQAFFRSYTFSLQVVDGIDQETPRAAKILEVTCNHVLRCKGNNNLAMWVNTETIGKHSWRRKGPASPTVELIPHNSVASRPVLLCAKVTRQVVCSHNDFVWLTQMRFLIFNQVVQRRMVPETLNPLARFNHWGQSWKCEVVWVYCHSKETKFIMKMLHRHLAEGVFMELQWSPGSGLSFYFVDNFLTNGMNLQCIKLWIDLTSRTKH